MNEQCCPNCGQITNSSSARLIEDSCGHVKCRMCLLYEEQGCKSCERTRLSKLAIDYTEPRSKSSDSSLICDEPTSSIIINHTSKPINNNRSSPCEVKQEKEEKGCKKVNSKKYLDRSHIITLPGVPERYKCTVCDKIFRNKKGKCYHDVCITGIQPYRCPICERSFVKKSHFEYHERTHSGIRPFNCELCDKAFPQKNKLNRHMLSHSQEKRFLCPKCGKRYVKKDDLKIHMFVHTGITPYVCKTCGKSFRIRSNLNRHMLSHSSARPHLCDFCGKSFKEKSLLARHTRIHGKDRPYSCAHCPRVFLSKSELRRHIDIHSDTKPFCCTICQTNFRRKDNLNRHIRHHHSGESSDRSVQAESHRKTVVKPPPKPKAIVKTQRKNTVKTNPPNRLKNSSKEPIPVALINPRIDSMGNITPVIRVPGESSNAVPVINGPIHLLRPEIRSESRKKTLTYTEPIPPAEAVVINQRIEAMLSQQSAPANSCFFDHHSSSETTPHMSMPLLPPLRHNPIKSVPLNRTITEARPIDSSYSPPINGTLIELKPSTDILQHPDTFKKVQNDTYKTKSDGINCVSTIKTNTSEGSFIFEHNNNNNNTRVNEEQKSYEGHWRRRTAEILKPHLNSSKKN